MTETVTPADQEDYIWAMRLSAHKDRTIIMPSEAKLLSEIAIKTDRPKPDNTQSTKVTLMATLVPDEVIHNHDNYEVRNFDACFLFGDVSGFTDLCEKYSKTGISGPSRMTQVLNKYLGAMVQEILSFGGDVLKFSGDAFLAMFKPDENLNMRDRVHEAIDCALVIQKNYGSYETDVGVIIRVKLAISSGPCVFSLIGNEQNSHYVVVGNPIWDVKTAESISSAGDIIIAPPAWAYVNPSEYQYQDMGDKIHVKITGIGPHWCSVQRSSVKTQQQRTSLTSENKSQLSLDNSDSSSDNEEIIVDQDEEFSLRPTVNLALKKDMSRNLPRFIIAPVMKSIDMNEPFEYLTEMRQTVIVFINVVWKKLTEVQMVDLVNDTYKIVCGVVNKVKGCVNKVSLFDKDLMLVVVFGLRGLKHELECQLALRSARKCLLKINSLDGVISTSIGVTTGITYCGVFGHSLRREYTVISLIVNKAARLMVNYKNQVTCDMETFLHSKMEASNFILQPYKPLKGISHPGPVYEFKEVDEGHTAEHKLNQYPILGRDNDIKLYLKLLDKCFKGRADRKTMLLVEADARQGKTRFIDELNFISKENYSVNSIHLRLPDKKIPYQAIKLLLMYPLKMSTNVNPTTVQKKIGAILKDVKDADMICCLNDIFGINFKINKKYKKMDAQEKTAILHHILTELSIKCFKSKWVMSIDNLQYMDLQSLEMFDIFLNLKNVFVVATFGRDTVMPSKQLENLLKNKRIMTSELGPIDKWYLGALACHFMNVYAIPAELEKTIQARSNGNCGWVQSFLIGMLQDDGLQILEADLRQINDLGLVSPPLYMMTRMAQAETAEWKHIMEERRLSMAVTGEDNWGKYIDSCRDSYVNVTIRGSVLKQKTAYTDTQLKVCVLSPNFHIINVSSELSSDSTAMKTFDSLNSYEQLLVKCSAILGSPFTRDMMIYVMNALEPYRVALAVQKLFEIRVLCCAKGDFLEGQNLVFKERLTDPRDIVDVKCRCRGVDIHESCRTLPGYASCGYMQFRSSLFREITYNLLTDHQKKDFHMRAIRYLERETRRCKACGKRFFAKILGAKYDRELMNEMKRRKPIDSSSDIFSEYDNLSVISASGRRQSGNSTVTTVTSISSHSLPTSGRRSQFNKGERLSAGSFISFTGSSRGRSASTHSLGFGFNVLKRLRTSHTLMRQFSNEDFTECQCDLILCSTYARLMEHCSGAGKMDKLVETMLEYGNLAIKFSNLPLAMQLMKEALKTLSVLYQVTPVNKWKLTLSRAKVFCLIGYSYLKLDQIDEALVYLKKSLAEYGFKLPSNILHTKLQTIGCRLKQTFGFFLFPNMFIKRLNYWETVYTNNLAECLTYLSDLFQRKNKWHMAFLLASWSVNTALSSYSDFKVICEAYTNMLVVTTHFRWKNLSIALELHSLSFVHLKSQIDIDEMKAVTKLYGAIFYSRVRRGSMDKSIQIGFIVLRLSAAVNGLEATIHLIPLMLQCLLMVTHTTNVIALLQELDYVSAVDIDSTGKIWYFALCIGFQIETGYTVVPYEDAEKLFQLEGVNWAKIKDRSAVKRYFTVMWLWCVRNEKWEASALWFFHHEKFVVVPNSKTTFIDKITALYQLEALLLCLVYKIDKHAHKTRFMVKNRIDELIKALDNNLSNSKMLQPRFYHFKAYYRLITDNDGRVTTILSKAKALAKKLGNHLEMQWIDHSYRAWNDGLSAEVMAFWKEHSDPDNAIDYHDLEISGGKYHFFTLPQPIFC